ncbi:hypothetical protein QJQ45_000155 [Haematococcus lacustris]|nr:hypothetical protein QJQ45_000155 [Haematococcus lacustris]
MYNQLHQHRHPMLMPVFEDPSNQALLAKLKELGNMLAVSMQQHFANPGKERFVKLYAKAARARLGWSGDEAQLFIRMACGHITVTLATWDAVWEVNLDPNWARQRLRLHGAQDRALEKFLKQLEEDMAEVPMERHGRTKQLVVFCGAASIGTGGRWGDDAVLRACCKVVCRPRGSGQLRGRVVLVDEHRTTRVSSAVNGQQPCEEEMDHDGPPQAPTGPRQQPGSLTASSLRAWAQHSPSAKRSKRTEAEQGKGNAAKAKPAPQPGRWLDRDCNAALNMQRIGKSRWRPLELCWWPKQIALRAKGKEYPGLGYKRLRDKPPKVQQQQPAVAQ